MTLGDALRKLTRPDTDRTDGELLGRFVLTRDESAFAELLRRHGPTVYGVCRRVLGDSHDADDAFQATFLVLVCKAGSIRPPGMVGNWLYGVAVRTANKARVMKAKRATRDWRIRLSRALGASASTAFGGEDVSEIIDAELAALPAVYRAAFVACELNGCSRSEAAKELGWPEGTLATRLAKARKLLAARLTKRGITPAAGALTAVLVPHALAANTLNAVREMIAVGAATAVAPLAQTLSAEVVKTMSAFKLKLLTLGLIATVLAGGTALIGSPGERPGPRGQRMLMTNAPVPKPPIWKEAKPIELDGGRITSVAYAPSGKNIAVVRDGKIDFLDAKTRKHVVSMKIEHDPKLNPSPEVGTITAIAFRPTPHPKLGDVFAVTHKHGLRIGAMDLGIMASSSVREDGINPGYKEEGFDAHQIIWVSDNTIAMSNGSEMQFSMWKEEEKEGIGGRWRIPSTERGKPVVLAAIPGEKKFLSSDGEDRKTKNGMHIRSENVKEEVTCQLLGHKSRPTFATVAKDGKRIVTADEGGTLIVWEGAKFDFKEKSRIEQGPGLAALALAPDGKTVAVLRSHGVDWLGAPANRSSTVFALFVFDATDPPAKPTAIWTSETRSLPGKVNGPVSLAFGPDGKTLLAAFADPYTSDAKLYGPIPKSMGVRVWELTPGK